MGARCEVSQSSPSDAGGVTGRLFVFAGKVAFDSNEHSGWRAGAVGDSSRAAFNRRISMGALAIRSWWPAGEQVWFLALKRSCWSFVFLFLEQAWFLAPKSLSSQVTFRPKLRNFGNGAPFPERTPFEHTELIAVFPRVFSLPSELAHFAQACCVWQHSTLLQAPLPNIYPIFVRVLYGITAITSKLSFYFVLSEIPGLWGCFAEMNKFQRGVQIPLLR